MIQNIKTNTKTESVSQKTEIVSLSRRAYYLEQKRRRKKLLVKIGAAAVVLLMITCNLCLRERICDIDEQILKTEAIITENDSQLTLLYIEFEHLVSYSNLEEEAKRLGMDKKTKSQVHYIYRKVEDSGEIVKK